MATPWRLAEALKVLRAEVNARWPDRDKRSDGSIGDADHATRNSDHNPWLKSNGVGVVRAIDLDKDLTGPATDPRAIRDDDPIVALAEHVRALGRAGDPRLVGGGYVILRGRIASEVGGWAWRPYTGVNAHAHHLHVSVSRNASGYDSRAPWGVGQEVDLSADDVARLTRIESKLDEVLTQLYGPRPTGRIEGWSQLGGRTLVDAVAEVLTKAGKLPAATVDELLGRKLPTPTWRDGNVVVEDTPVGLILPRGGEASITRHRNEVGAKGATS